MACGDSNSSGGCGGGIEKKKVFTYDNLKYLLSKLSGKICLAVGSIKFTAERPLHLDKTFDEDGILVNGYIDEVTTSASGLMTADDKVLLDNLATGYTKQGEEIAKIEEEIGTIESNVSQSQEDIKSLQESVSGLSESEEKIDERVTKLEEASEEHTTQITALEGTSGEHTTQITALEEAVGKIDLSNYVKNTDFASTSADGILSKEDYEELYNLYDTVFIACRAGRDEENEINLVMPSAWAHYSNRTPYGIAVVQDNRLFIVALDESEEPIAWSSAYGLVGEALSTSTEAVVDSDGEGETEAIIAASKEGFITDTDDYAAGYCHNYGNDMFPAGNWYLPSMYELLVIKKNLRAINYALNVIGATPIRYEATEGQAYWASSEYGTNHAWQLNMRESHLVWNNKVTSKYYVRPITAMKTTKSVEYSLEGILVYNGGEDIPSTGGTYAPSLNVLRGEVQGGTHAFTILSEGEYSVSYSIVSSSTIFTLNDGVLTVAENTSGSRQFATIIASITSTAPDKTSLSVSTSTTVYCAK